MSDAICRICGSTHQIHHNQLVARGLIRHKWNGDNVHVPEEAKMVNEALSEEEARARGLLPPTLREDEPTKQNYPQPFGDMTLLSPDIVIDKDEKVINYKGENYYRAEPADPFKPDPEMEKRHMRREALDYALKLHVALIGEGGVPDDTSVVTTADAFAKFLQTGEVKTD